MSREILEQILSTLALIERKINQCDKCEGYGCYIFMGEEHKCSACNGIGVIRIERKDLF